MILACGDHGCVHAGAAPARRGHLRLPESAGSVGFSNCGPVASAGMGLLVDNQFDLPVTGAVARCDRGVLSDSGSSCGGEHARQRRPLVGNQLWPDAESIGSAAMGHGVVQEVQPAEVAVLAGHNPPNTSLGAYMRRGIALHHQRRLGLDSEVAYAITVSCTPPPRSWPTRSHWPASPPADR